MTSPGSGLDLTESSSSLITKRKIQEMVAQIDPSERLEPEVEDVRVIIGNVGAPGYLSSILMAFLFLSFCFLVMLSMSTHRLQTITHGNFS
jgi:hypothetical protein